MGNVLEIGECFEFRADVDRNDLHEVHSGDDDWCGWKGGKENKSWVLEGVRNRARLMSHFAAGAGTLLPSPRALVSAAPWLPSSRPALQAAGVDVWVYRPSIRREENIPFAPAPS